jgi:DNA-binding FrmR family transcriptional regulator
VVVNDPDAQRRVLNRLKRARGQLDAVIASVESGGRCRDVVTQLSAVSSALDRAGLAIIATAM